MKIIWSRFENGVITKNSFKKKEIGEPKRNTEGKEVKKMAGKPHRSPRKLGNDGEINEKKNSVTR